MKKIAKLFSVLFASSFILAFVTSCEKVLDVEQKMELSDEIALTSTFGLQNALLGSYDRMQGSAIFGGHLWASGAMLSDIIIKSGEGNIVYEETQMLDKNMTADNLIVGVAWQNCYYTINLVNQVMQAIPSVEASGDKEIAGEKDRIEGECLFIRGTMHFELLRYFGNQDPGSPANNLGVPIIIEPTGIESKPARNTIQEVYSQIITDLERAAQLLPETNKGRATKYSAMAILSRVYFFKTGLQTDPTQNSTDYEKSGEYATAVINSGQYLLIDSVVDNYQEVPSQETIFAILSVENDYSAGALNGYYRQASSAKFSPAGDIIKIYQFTGGLSDQRYTKLFAEVNNKIYSTKFNNRYMSIPIIRLAELYLNRSEARYRNNDMDGALADMNMVKVRAGLEPATEMKYYGIGGLYYERLKELYLEGDVFHNKCRLHEDKISNYKLPWNDLRFIFPIPQRELDVNPNLIQN